METKPPFSVVITGRPLPPDRVLLVNGKLFEIIGLTACPYTHKVEWVHIEPMYFLPN